MKVCELLKSPPKREFPSIQKVPASGIQRVPASAANPGSKSTKDASIFGAHARFLTSHHVSSQAGSVPGAGGPYGIVKPGHERKGRKSAASARVRRALPTESAPSPLRPRIAYTPPTGKISAERAPLPVDASSTATATATGAAIATAGPEIAHVALAASVASDADICMISEKEVERYRVNNDYFTQRYINNHLLVGFEPLWFEMLAKHRHNKLLLPAEPHCETSPFSLYPSNPEKHFLDASLQAFAQHHCTLNACSQTSIRLSFNTLERLDTAFKDLSLDLRSMQQEGHFGSPYYKVINHGWGKNSNPVRVQLHLVVSNHDMCASLFASSDAPSNTLSRQAALERVRSLLACATVLTFRDSSLSDELQKELLKDWYGDVYRSNITKKTGNAILHQRQQREQRYLRECQDTRDIQKWPNRRNLSPSRSV